MSTEIFRQEIMQQAVDYLNSQVSGREISSIEQLKLVLWGIGRCGEYFEKLISTTDAKEIENLPKFDRIEKENIDKLSKHFNESPGTRAHLHVWYDEEICGLRDFAIGILLGGKECVITAGLFSEVVHALS